ncbi:AEL_collapsed_G0018020.mRNA.1.CDS.1 [Saccharomyces cerevisiae]|nr:AEL_collapsed_G0018020.mRNA.1.CDS.1 [Saccharomyces cerevisiae]
MRYFHKQQAHFWKPVLDLLTVLSASSILSTFADPKSTATADQYLKSASKETASCNQLKTDTLDAGYGKILGKGRISQDVLIFIVKARLPTPSTQKKKSELRVRRCCQ